MASLVGGRRWASYHLGAKIMQPTRQVPLAGLQKISAAMGQPERSYSKGSGLTWRQFLDGGSTGISEVVVHEGGNRVKLSWADGHESQFSLKWLRDHSTGAFNGETKQRELDTYMVPNDTPLKHAVVETAPSAPSSTPARDGDTVNGSHQVLRLEWDANEDNAEEYSCTVPAGWLRRHCSSPTARNLRQRFGTSVDVVNDHHAQVLWDAGVFSIATDNSPPIMGFKEIWEDDRPPSPAPSLSSPETATARLIGLMKSHGIALVRGVPAANTEQLALKVAGHMRSTYYGQGMWTIAAKPDEGGQQYLDSAYTSKALALHTDNVYLTDPPGFQVFRFDVKAPEGGMSIYIDGFAVAERLRVENPEAFEFLTQTPIKYHCFDDGCHYVSEGPIFQLGPLGQVDQVRYNDYDRAPLDYLSNDDIDRFYEHHKTLCAILRDPSMVVRILLEPGDTVIFNNRRAIHGREAYKGWRRMTGCYIGMDEVRSTARLHGY